MRTFSRLPLMYTPKEAFSSSKLVGNIWMKIRNLSGLMLIFLRSATEDISAFNPKTILNVKISHWKPYHMFLHALHNTKNSLRKSKTRKNSAPQILRMCRSGDSRVYHSLLSLPDALHCRQGEYDTRTVMLWKFLFIINGKFNVLQIC